MANDLATDLRARDSAVQLGMERKRIALRDLVSLIERQAPATCARVIQTSPEMAEAVAAVGERNK